jgi:hypothetical protein
MHAGLVAFSLTQGRQSEQSANCVSAVDRNRPVTADPKESRLVHPELARIQ